MSASLEQSRYQVIHSAAELADVAGGETLQPYLDRYYRHVATEDVLARSPEDLLGAALSHKELAANRPVGTANVRVFTPTVQEEGWSCGHTVIEIVTDDMPFLVDSVSSYLTHQGHAIHLIIHPVIAISREIAGSLGEVLDDDAGTVVGDPEVTVGSWMHLKIDRDTAISGGERMCGAMQATSSVALPLR